MTKYFLFFLMLLQLLSNAWAMECIEKGKIRYLYNKKTIIENHGYCFDQKNLYFADYQCHQDKKCQALSVKTSISQLSDFKSQIGTPVFALCKHFGGKPRFIEFLNKNTWEQDEICIFKDQSFVGIYYLPTLLKEKK